MTNAVPKVFKLNVVLHKNQQIIENSPAKFKVIKTGKRFGKSVWAQFAACKAAAKYPNSLIWYIAPDNAQTKRIAWKSLINLIPESAIKNINKTELFIELINGSVIQLIGAENLVGLRGVKVRGAILDEAAYMDEEVWHIIQGQLLGNEGDTFIYAISSPNSKGRNWFSDKFEEAKQKKASGDKDWDAFYFTIKDNPWLSEADVAKLEQSIPDFTWNLEYLAIESDYAGRLISEFDAAHHIGVVDDKDITYWTRSIDWGIDHPTVCLWLGIDDKNKRVFVKQEFVKSGYIIEESKKAICELSTGMTIEWTTIDPSTVKRNSQTNLTDKSAFEMNPNSIPCIPGVNQSRGIDIMKMFFKKNMIVIHPSCKNLINEIKNYQRGDKVGDDCLDALRYGLVRVNDCYFRPDGETKVDLPQKFDYLSLYDRRMFKTINVEEQNSSWILEEMGVEI